LEDLKEPVDQKESHTEDLQTLEAEDQTELQKNQNKIQTEYLEESQSDDLKCLPAVAENPLQTEDLKKSQMEVQGESINNEQKILQTHTEDLKQIESIETEPQSNRETILKWLSLSSHPQEWLDNEKNTEHREPKKGLERTFSYEVDQCRENVEIIHNNLTSSLHYQEEQINNDINAKVNAQIEINNHLDSNGDSTANSAIDNEIPNLIETTNRTECTTETMNGIYNNSETDVNVSAKITRNSDSRRSIKKCKHKKSLKGNEKVSEQSEAQLSDDSKRKSKSIEVFDFYVSSIDDQVNSSNIETSNGGSKVSLSNERDLIESLLNTGTVSQDPEKEMNGANYNKDICDEEEPVKSVNKSNQGSKCNTLRRGKHSRNSSKKRRKSKHIL